MKIGVTGATGQLGRLVVAALKTRTAPENIVALARTPEKGADLGVEVRAFDYGQPDKLADALKGIDRLLLISGSEVGKRFQQHHDVIVAAKAAGVKLLVYTSVLRVETSTLFVAPDHVATEEFLPKAGIPYTILRNGWYTENYLGGLKGAIDSGVLYGASGEGKISAAPRADYAEAAAVVLTSEGHEGKVYELAGDEAFTMSDLAAAVAKQVGKPMAYQNVTEQDVVDGMVKSGLPEGLAKLLASADTSTAKGDLFDDTHTLSKLIGRPTTSLQAVLEQNL